MPIKTTERGFDVYAEITDTYGEQVDVRESSAASSPCVWVGVGRASAHLNVQMATELRDALTEFLEAVPTKWDL